MAKLSKEQVRKLTPGQTLTVVCDDAPEMVSAYETARQVRRELEVENVKMPISASYKTLTVIIRRF